MVLRDELISYVSKIVKDSTDAEDIVQDVLLTSLEKRYQLKNESLYRNWIFKIAKHKSIDFCKKPKAIQSSDFNFDNTEAKSDPESPIQTMASCHERNFEDLFEIYFHEKKGIPEVLTYFAEIFPEASNFSEKHLEVFFLVEVDHLSQVEVARKLDLPLPTVKSRYQRSKKKIRQLFFACCNFEFDSKGNVMGYSLRKEIR